MLDAPWAMTPEDVAARLDVTPATGLSEDQVRQRREAHGTNRLREHPRRGLLEILIDQLRSVIVVLLAIAGLLALLFGEIAEAVAVGVVLLINTAIGFATERRAVRSMEALRDLGTVRTTVRRDGETKRIDAVDLVPGDWILVEGGDVVTADARLISSSNLQVDESTLTGESLPVEKRTAAVAEDALLADRWSMIFKGTAISRGSGEAVVVRTGVETELGTIAELVAEAEDTSTPLQVRLENLGRRLLWVTLAVAVLVGVIGWSAGRSPRLIVETAIALAVAAIPEGLPIVATIALARGMARMAKRNALVERLEAVETLGSVEVILTDKTGTLTENRMTVDRVRLADRWMEITGGYGVSGDVETDGEPVNLDGSPTIRQLLKVATLCNNADFGSDDEPVGDPMEVAMLMAAAKAGLNRSRLSDDLPRVREEAFDPDLKMMATVHRSGDSFLVAAKGAPLEVIQRCVEVAVGPDTRPLDEETAHWWLEQNELIADEGLRVLALADGEVENADADPYGSLRLLGLIGLIDPPRRDIRDSIEAARSAGVRVVMVTGDQEPTAVHVAASVGLDADHVVNGREILRLEEMSDSQREKLRQASILARTSPSQKLDIIEIHQRSGSTVAMIGDGVNDAPALKRADIGVAMGMRGTEVAKEASDMILRDDSFGSIVAAIEQGRVIFRNIRVFVLYLLSCNLSEVMAVGVASAFAVPLPILPLQILYLNLVTDVFPALALGAGKGSSNVLRQRPRDPSEPILTGSHWRLIIVYGVLITAAVMTGLLIATHVLDLHDERAVTISFLTLAFAQLWHVFNMVGRSESSIHNEVTRNRWVWAAIGLGTVLLLFPLVVPALSEVLSVSPLNAGEWLLVAGLSLMPLIIGRLFHGRLGVD